MSALSEIIDRLERTGQGEAAHAMRHVRDVAEQRQNDLHAKDDRIREYMDICEDLSRKLEEARGRIGELRRTVQMIAEYPITHSFQNQDAANMAELARVGFEGIKALDPTPETIAWAEGVFAAEDAKDARIASLEAAIKPFVEWLRAMESHPQVVSSKCIFDDDDMPFTISVTWGDLRRLAAHRAMIKAMEEQG